MTLRRSAVFVLAFCLWLIPCQSPPLIPSRLNWARLAGALIAAGAAAFEMRGRRIPQPIVPRRRIHRLWLAFAVGAASFLLVYYFFVFHISTGEGSVAVPVGFGSNCCDQLPNKDCIDQKLILSYDAVRRCWGDSIYLVHLGLMVTYWWTAGAGGALVGLLLLRWGADRAGQGRASPPEMPGSAREAPSPAPEFAYDLFLSYARRDQDFVAGLVEDLQNHGLKIWWDQHKLGAGDPIDSTIQQGLRTSRHFAVVLSPSSVISEWVLAEAGYARSQVSERMQKGMTSYLIPILYQECDIPLLLQRTKYANFTGSRQQGLDELLHRLLPPSGHPRT